MGARLYSLMQSPSKLLEVFIKSSGLVTYRPLTWHVWLGGGGGGDGRGAVIAGGTAFVSCLPFRFATAS